jgi:AhpD family alkylhydroperoxidase
MTVVEVFDPPMCCSTGVCGPSVDPALATFAADLQWAGENGARVTRYNLAQEPGRFAGHDAVRALLAEGGEEVLPVVVVDGEVRSSGRYPARAELAAWALPAAAADVLDEVTAELVAIGAAVGANCEPCFKFHYGKARRAGAGTGAITAAVKVAQAVKDAPAQSMLSLAARLLGTSPEALAGAPAGAGRVAVVPAAADPAPAAEAAGACCGEETPAAADEAQPQADRITELPLAGAATPCCGGGTAEEASAETGAAGQEGCCG